MTNDDFRHTPTPSASENAPTDREVSETPLTATSELEHSLSNYETTLKGAELAREILRQAQERAYRASVAYEQQLTAKIEADRLKRAEVRAELDLLRAQLSGADPQEESAESRSELENALDADPTLYKESWD